MRVPGKGLSRSAEAKRPITGPAWSACWCKAVTLRSAGLRPQTVALLLGKEVSRIFASWNQLDGWLWQVEGLRHVA